MATGQGVGYSAITGDQSPLVGGGRLRGSILLWVWVWVCVCGGGGGVLCRVNCKIYRFIVEIGGMLVTLLVCTFSKYFF